MNYEGLKVAVIGYGIEGQDAEKFLKSKGATVTILDKKDNENYLDNLNEYQLIVRSPGVYPFKKELISASENNIKIITPTQIFFEEFTGKIIGVTGTKGKGTTSTLIYEILRSAKIDVHLAGNIGKSPLELLPVLTKDSYVVLEMSSFQLIDLLYSPHISVVLNITSDHMDWHKDQSEYINAKKNIVSHQTESDWAVINDEYEVPRSFSSLTKANIVTFNKIKLDEKFKSDLILRGVHNHENIAAAVEVARILKVSEDLIIRTVKNFKGLVHRLEFVRDVNGVKYYNDSFATGPQPTIAAIKSFTEPETIILGGSDKGLDYQELGDSIEMQENVKNVILIGQIREQIKKHIKNKTVIDLGFASMKDIVKTANNITEKGGVVILSPAAASFDMFKDYKDRGYQFKEEVNNLRELEDL
jgi:UDP-N-acetylmuramoylalanine--D-glutamate ligase